MTTSAPPLEQQLRRLEHDIKNSLNVISLGLDVLKSVRTDESQFAEVCQAIEAERKQAGLLVAELVQTAREGNPL
jgi:signal transduction histidine kinase